MRYKIDGEYTDDGEDKYFEDEDEVFDYCIDEEYHSDDEGFEEWVDDREDSVTINGETYYPYDILSNLDYSNLDSLKCTYMDEQNDNDKENARWEFRHNPIGHITWVQRYPVQTIEEYGEDTDGDEDLSDGLLTPEEALEELRKAVADMNIQQEEEKKTNEDELMKMFQVIGD